MTPLLIIRQAPAANLWQLAHLASHYRIDPRAGMPARGQEKPDVESGVKALQKRACTPVPTAVDLEELKWQLHRFCVSELDRTVSG